MRRIRSFSPGVWRAASASAFAALFLALSGPASAGIADTKHNLGSSNPRAENKSSSTDEICVFCHTPHGADTTAPAPLWNKRLPTVVTGPGGTYQTYDQLQTPSLDGTVAAVGSVSLACLSCHDGTQAMDNIINAPGSGNYDPTGGGPGGLAWAWTGPRVNTTTGAMNNAGGGIAMLGTDLRNDHPIGIQYCGGPTAGGAIGTCKDGDFNAMTSAVINGNTVFWVETGTTNGVKHRTDLPLYVRPDNVALGPLVECGSCHDPHVSEGQTGPNSLNAGATFLRIANTGSAVCTACHVK